MNRIMECVPNFSEGRDKAKVEQIADAFRGREGVKLLDYSSDADHNRSVITAVGEPEALKSAVIDAVGRAVELIDLTRQSGQHPTAGAVAVGARMPLVAYNVNLGTDNLEIATAIAKKVRFVGGGLRYCKAMGVTLGERGITQVSMNLTDFTKTAIYRAHELVRIEAQRYGVPVVGAEVIGLVPMEALVDAAAYYLGLENFSMSQVLEAKLME